MRILSTILLLIPFFNELPVEETYHCPQAVRLAASVGWAVEDLEMIDRIMWAESRCHVDAVSSTGDYGLFQLNWSANNRWLSNAGYDRDSLLVSSNNARAALMLAHYAEIQYGCKFQPWYMSGTWC